LRCYTGAAEKALLNLEDVRVAKVDSAKKREFMEYSSAKLVLQELKKRARYKFLVNGQRQRVLDGQTLSHVSQKKSLC
jgi:hypothetical protein